MTENCCIKKYEVPSKKSWKIILFSFKNLTIMISQDSKQEI